MISLWIGILALAAIALMPLALCLRQNASARGRREAALALHRAQLAELDRDITDGRIGPLEHSAAVLEVQRRLLQAAEMTETATSAPSRSAIWATLIMVPAAALLLYLTGGSPELPAMPLKARMTALAERVHEQAILIEELRQVLKGLDPKSEKAREGYILLGNAEARLGDMQGAAKAWQTALDSHFDPALAVETAEAITEANGHVTADAATLFRRALTEGDPHAPWRVMAQRRLDMMTPSNSR